MTEPTAPRPLRLLDVVDVVIDACHPGSGSLVDSAASERNAGSTSTINTSSPPPKCGSSARHPRGGVGSFPGEDHNDFKYRLLELVLERSGRPFALGLSEVDVGRMKPLQRWNRASRLRSQEPFALSVGSTALAAVEPSSAGGADSGDGWNPRAAQRLDPSAVRSELQTIRGKPSGGEIVLLQGLGWSDVEIFDAAGLRTFTARSENLFRLGGSPTGCSCFPVLLGAETPW